MAATTLTDLFEVQEAILEKLRCVDSFFSVLAEFVPAFSSQSEEAAYLRAVGCKHAGSLDRRQSVSLPTLNAVVSIVTLLAALPLVPAWSHSLPQPGSTDDTDFWLMLQSSTMQLLGLFTAVFPIYHRRSHGAAWNWSILFTAAGSLSAVAAIPAYLYLPTFWSGLLSFIGAGAQVYLALQLCFLASSSSAHIKVD